MTRRVVITGAGTVGPAGTGLEALRCALQAGRTDWSAVDRSQGFHLERSARLAGLLGENPYAPWLSLREARRMSPASSMAVCAAAQAVAAAGLTPAELAGPETAVSLGTSFGSTNYASSLLQQMKATGPLSISPLLFMETVANAHAGQVALATGATGPNYTLSQREASGLLAVARGAQLVASGKATRALVGCVDEVSPILHAMLDRFGALARPSETNDLELARVFDRQRAGFTISAGGTVFLLEEEGAAQTRGAEILACVRAVVRANDPSAPATDWGRGHAQLAGRLIAGLERQGVDVASVERVVSGAAGSRRGDRLEALTLRAVFGDELELPVLAPKSVTGEYGGGFLAAGLLALEGLAWPTPGFETLDPELGVAPHDGAPLSRARRLLTSSLAAGGAAVWVVLDAGEV
jgi:3-oxoacyl-(acyl-carrier-protein) synthase